jgi:hypothetical protein
MLLPMSTSNEVIEDKRIKLNVQDFKIAHEKALISNAMVFVSSRNRIGNFTRAIVSYFSAKEGNPISHLEALENFLQRNKKTQSCNMLFNHGIQFRIPDNLGSHSNHLSPEEYQSHFKELNK